MTEDDTNGELPACVECGATSYSKGGRFNSYSCDECEYTPRRYKRDVIVDVLPAVNREDSHTHREC